MIVYKTTNLITGKFYIGKDTKNDPNYLGSGTHLRNSIKKYGKENFQKEILEECIDHDTLCQREIYWIAELNAMNLEVGYNILPGGEGWDSESARISGKIGNLNQTSEFRGEYSKRGWNNLSEQQKSERAKLIWSNKTVEERSEIAIARWEKKTPKERSAIRQETWDNASDEVREKHSASIKESWKDDTIRKERHKSAMKDLHNRMTSEQRSERARKGALNKTPEQKAERARVAREGRKRAIEARRLAKLESLKF
jgi:hypothetical protein